MLGEKYTIVMAGRSVGIVHIKHKDLYYHLACSCSLPDDRFYRVVAECNGEQINVGICVPEDDHYTVTARIPVCKIKNDRISFQVIRADAQENNRFPVSGSITSSTLENLMNGRFETIGDCPYIRIIQRHLPAKYP